MTNIFFFFFFQAEDGIRDYKVTGVQTCALPICIRPSALSLQAMSDSAEGRMQALQLGNMMAGEQLQQLVKLRQLVMAQINAQSVYMATQTNREAQRAATQSEWVRNGNADAPPLESTPAGVSRGRARRP